MSNTYTIIDKDDNEYLLNNPTNTFNNIFNNSLARSQDIIDLSFDTIEKTSLPGSIQTSLKKLSSKELTLSSEFAIPEQSQYVSWVNELIYNLQKAQYLKIDSKKTKVVFSKLVASYSAGSQHLSGSIDIDFFLLDGFWEDIIIETIPPLVVNSTGLQVINNTGLLSTPPIFTLEATSLVNSVKIQVPGKQIIITDNNFGTVGFEIMIIDMNQGKVTISNFDRTKNIVPGTSYFPLSVGENQVTYTVNGTVTIDVTYTNRYYI